MRWGLTLVAALMANAPPAAPVVSFDPSTDFSHFRSYSWVFAHPPSTMDQNLYRQIRVSIDRSLEAQGFVQSAPGDFAVAFTVGPRVDVHASDYGHYAPYYGGEEAALHQSWVNRELAERSDNDKMLSIDIYDTYSKHSIWHGIAPDPIVANTRQGIVEHEVDDVLSRFPPRNVCAQAPNGGPACVH